MKQIIIAIAVFGIIVSSSFARDRYLLLDDRIIEKAENAKLTVGTVEKHKANPLFTEEKPWEKRFDNLYGNVLYDEEEKIYKCWYSPFLTEHEWDKTMTAEERQAKGRKKLRNREMGVCYATSKDGIKWEKPNLNLVEYEGSKENNIILRGPHGAGVFKDNYDPDPKRRYKMIMKSLSTSYSADGLNWSEPEKIIKLGRIPADTHNNMFWDPASQKYVGITRTFGDKERQVTRIESPDLKTWTKTGVILQGLDKTFQTYSMPVFIYADVYIGLVAIIHQKPVDRVWTELAWSPDSIKWHRIDPGTPLIPCSEKMLDYDYGCVYACAYPVFKDNEIQLYYGGSDYLHTHWRAGSLCLATLRPDGFAGYEQENKDKPAVITTSSIPYAGQDIQVTADVMKDGQVDVTVLDADGKAISKAKTISETVTDGLLKLSEEIKAEKIQLKLEITNAKLYSFNLEEK